MKAIAWCPMPIIKPALKMPFIMSLVSFSPLVMRIDSHLDQLLLPPQQVVTHSPAFDLKGTEALGRST